MTSLYALDPHRALTQYTRAVWTEAQGLPQDYIHAITQTADGYLWVGTDEGLTRFDGYDFVTFNKQWAPCQVIQWVLAPGADNAIWIGTSGELTRYQNYRFTMFTTKDGISDNQVVSLCQDHTGILWIAVGSRYRTGNWNTATARWISGTGWSFRRTMSCRLAGISKGVTRQAIAGWQANAIFVFNTGDPSA